jgi:hypothetical protein
MFLENSDHNSSVSDVTELTKSHSETVTKCHDQNDVMPKVSVLGDPDTEILESENQIVEGLVQELSLSVFGTASFE